MIETTYNKIPFRMSCPSCGIDLHSCKQCRFYQQGKPNDCNVPHSLFVRDESAYNFCEDFALKEDTPQKEKPNQDAIKKVLGEMDVNESKNSFDSLFK